jgi:hypothetical protein
MQTILRYSLTVFIFLGIFFQGCEDLDENARSIVSPEAQFGTVGGLNSVLNGMYAQMRGNSSWSKGFGESQYMTIMFGADDLTTRTGGNKEEFRQFDQFNSLVSKESSDWMKNLWTGCYHAIINANTIITNSEFTQGNPNEIDNIVGQAYFVRGFCYFYLVQGWGRIPVFTEPLAPESVGRSEITDTYDLIVSDFIKAENLLPDRQSDVGRPNKGAAKAYLAKVYLTMAGWPVKDVSGYALAASKAKEVIDSSAFYGFELLPEFRDLWLRANDNHSETIFAIQYDIDAWGRQNHLIGKPCLPEDGFGGWSDFFPELTFYLEFPDGPRKDATFLDRYPTAEGDTINYPDMSTRHPSYAKFLDGAYEDPARGFSFTTTEDPELYSSGFSCSAAYVLMRYADLLLVYAEAQAQSSGPDATAYEAINLVRDRAGLDNLPAGLNKEDFVNAVIDERGWELAGEGQRWFDLIRTEKLPEAMAKRDSDEDVGVLGDYNNRELWHAPIPLEDVLKNPNLRD